MHKNTKDISGQRFGRLTVIESVGIGKGGLCYWKCKCDCGNEKIASGALLRKGNTRSCGCLLRDFNIESSSTHRLSRTRIYNIWNGMKDRTSENSVSYKNNYKKNKITTCDEWKNDFMSFYEWAIKNGYSDEKLPNGRYKWTIDRIDNLKGYCPENCRWATVKQQANNRCTNRLVNFRGEVKTIKEWAEFLGLSPTTIRERLNRGLSPEIALTMPPQSKNKWTKGKK